MLEQKRVLSIQSFVTYGHVGNSTAVFTMQRMGIDVCPLLTVQFSNHTGYDEWEGNIFKAQQLGKILHGVGKRGIFPSIGALLSGYVGDPSIGSVIIDAYKKIAEVNPNLIYLCDPVIGDQGRGVYVKAGIEGFLKSKAIPRANIITPNHFEAEYLTGQAINSLEDALKAVEILHSMGPEIVIITSLEYPEVTSSGSLATLASQQNSDVWLILTKKIPQDVTGTGDTFSALFLGYYLRTQDIKISLEYAVSAIYAVVEKTYLSQSKELQLIHNQEEIACPSNIISSMKVNKIPPTMSLS